MGYKNTSLGLKQRLRPLKEFLSYGTLLVFLPHTGYFQGDVFLPLNCSLASRPIK